MNRRAASLSLLLFGSGFCALLYQTVWLRQFRLIFGASTAASAAVLAIFMGGLGVGGILIGERVERSRNPLAVYGGLEIGVAISAGLTPLLFFAVRTAYLAMGDITGNNDLPNLGDARGALVLYEKAIQVRRQFLTTRELEDHVRMLADLSTRRVPEPARAGEERG